MKDNLSEILDRLWVPFDGSPVQRCQGRRVYSMAGGKRRPFAGVVYGSDVLKPLEEGSSSSVNLGASLPSPGEMVHREQVEEIEKEILKNKDKFPLPKKDDGRFKF
jgi:hypothetical protein